MNIVVDEKLTFEFMKGDVTAQAYRAYLRQVFERKGAVGKVASGPDEFEYELSFKEKAIDMNEALKAGRWRVDREWERQFIEDNIITDEPSDKQIARLEGLWRRYRMATL